MFLRVVEVTCLKDYELRLRFSDGVVKVVDLRDELFGEVFEPLKDTVIFRAVIINPNTNTIEWPNGADFAPEFLYRIGKTVAAAESAAA